MIEMLIAGGKKKSLGVAFLNLWQPNGASTKDSEQVRCIDLDDGSIKWESPKKVYRSAPYPLSRRSFDYGGYNGEIIQSFQSILYVQNVDALDGSFVGGFNTSFITDVSVPFGSFANDPGVFYVRAGNNLAYSQIKSDGEQTVLQSSSTSHGISTVTCLAAECNPNYIYVGGKNGGSPSISKGYRATSRYWVTDIPYGNDVVNMYSPKELINFGVAFSTAVTGTEYMGLINSSGEIVFCRSMGPNRIVDVNISIEGYCFCISERQDAGGYLYTANVFAHDIDRNFAVSLERFDTPISRVSFDYNRDTGILVVLYVGVASEIVVYETYASKRAFTRVKRISLDALGSGNYSDIKIGG